MYRNEEQQSLITPSLNVNFHLKQTMNLVNLICK